MNTLTDLLQPVLHDEINKRIIGSLAHKNVNIRNYSLMRNIGKYPLYDFPMFPEIGMVYNVYEHWLNRPVQHYTTGNTSWSKWKSAAAGQGINIDDDTRAINGLIEFNNGIYQDISGNAERFKQINGNRKKIIYSTNSNSVGLEGGEGLMSIVKAQMDEILNKYQNSKYAELFSLSDKNEIKSDLIFNNENVTENETTFAHPEEKDLAFQGGTLTFFDKNVSVMNTPSFSGIEDSEYKNASLLDKTNYLFSTGKIKSIISKSQTDDGESRGRALKNEAGDFCRVWTVSHQLSKMKDLIRPFIKKEEVPSDDFRTPSVETETEYRESFYRISEIQRKMFQNRPGLRPNGGGDRLEQMGVLQSNGLPTITPYHNKNGELVTSSIKKCMFSIENLAWKDIKKDAPVSFTDSNGNRTLSSNTLTKEQIGPNKGRIMWFPPYNLKFTENINAKWNANSFLGRGEDVYTYSNTERGGTLSFTLLIDHPLVIDAASSGKNKKFTDEDENKVLRFFAGCDDNFLSDELGDEISDNGNLQAPNRPLNNANATFESTTILIPLFFPNNYSGVDDRGNNLKPFLDYLFHNNAGICENDYRYESGLSSGKGSKLINPIKYTGNYDLDEKGSGKKFNINYKVDSALSNENLMYVKDGNNYYVLNGEYYEKSNDSKLASNYDSSDFGLNDFNGKIPEEFKKTFSTELSKNNLNELIYGTNIFSASDLVHVIENSDESLTSTEKKLKHILVDFSDKISSIDIIGQASPIGSASKNKQLAINRGNTLMSLLKLQSNLNDKTFNVSEVSVESNTQSNNDISSITNKVKTCAIAEIHFKIDEKDAYQNAGRANNETGLPDSDKTQQLTETKQNNSNTGDTSSNNKKMGNEEKEVVNVWNYDDEYKYFARINETDDAVRTKIIDKIKYFDPAYHSISPEGFNARLTFLHQCTRQGPSFLGDASNMAFGRAPYCVLRIGDFYNTKIVIDSITIEYGDNQMDLNPEGIGVQPLMANINLNFKFIGGTDLSGPIDRLQNAVSFNYYSNTSVYDRRADYRNAFIDEEDDNKLNYWNPTRNNPNETKNNN